jgi:hypothetical protein
MVVLREEKILITVLMANHYCSLNPSLPKMETPIRRNLGCPMGMSRLGRGS